MATDPRPPGAAAVGQTLRVTKRMLAHLLHKICFELWRYPNLAEFTRGVFPCYGLAFCGVLVISAHMDSLCRCIDQARGLYQLALGDDWMAEIFVKGWLRDAVPLALLEALARFRADLGGDWGSRARAIFTRVQFFFLPLGGRAVAEPRWLACIPWVTAGERFGSGCQG